MFTLSKHTKTQATKDNNDTVLVRAISWIQVLVLYSSNSGSQPSVWTFRYFLIYNHN